MDSPSPIPVLELALRFNAQILGDETLSDTGINESNKVRPGDVAFSDVQKYFQKTLESDATVLLLNAPAECPPGKSILIVENPFAVYDALLLEHRPFKPLKETISSRGEIHPTAIIEPGVVIAANVRIGANSYIQATAYIGEYTIIGEDCIIGPGAIIGPDAFYFKKQPDKSFKKW